uniref:Uncharacterized protein n=1 Tax=Xenopus tropicalis TaxID=8364 RepID=A0A803JW96_XENTR
SRRSPKQRRRPASGSDDDSPSMPIRDSDPDLPSDDPTPVSDLYVPPQPSIEEVRQTMQSLLDDAFALVAPSNSQAPGRWATPWCAV